MKAAMLLHQDRLMELIYHVRDDILFLILDDFASAQRAEVAYSFTKLNEALRHYDIRKVCMDFRKFDLLMLRDPKKLCIDSFSPSMFQTRIQKVACIALERLLSEDHVKALIKYLLPETDKGAAFKGFQDEQTAFCWLKNSQAS